MRWAVALLLLLMAGCSSSEGLPEAPVAADDSSARPRAESAERPPLPVEVAEVVRRDAQRVLRLTGTTQLWDSFSVSSEISGKVVALHVDEGDWVNKGDLLLELDRTRRLLELKTRKAELEKRQLELQFARKNLDRARTLLQRGAISQEELDALEQTADLAVTALQLAELQVEVIEDELEDASIYSPVAGQVSKRDVSLGENVLPAAPLLTLIQYDPIKLVTEIPEVDLYKVRSKTPVEIVFDALPGRTFKGAIHRIDPQVNPQSGAFRAEIRVSNPGHLLRAGMVARIEVAAEVYRDALIVPLNAVLDEGEGRYVFLVSQGRARRTAVELVSRLGSEAVVEGPLQEGDLVVTRGGINLTDGAAVEHGGNRPADVTEPADKDGPAAQGSQSSDADRARQEGER
ncbi:MAG TPA: efflux RND transporter periplasmic adaptor subunit [Acidobacteriota bacterium]|nr:efflux RND transporter periplasmic adaptor subunit [Acidobacteriota bacterium]